MRKRINPAIVLCGAALLSLFIAGCGLRERPDAVRYNPGKTENGAAPNSGGKLVLDELEQEIDELLDLLNQMDTVEDSDLDL